MSFSIKTYSPSPAQLENANRGVIRCISLYLQPHGFSLEWGRRDLNKINFIESLAPAYPTLKPNSYHCKPNVLGGDKSAPRSSMTTRYLPQSPCKLSPLYLSFKIGPSPPSSRLCIWILYTMSQTSVVFAASLFTLKAASARLHTEGHSKVVDQILVWKDLWPNSVYLFLQHL